MNQNTVYPLLYYIQNNMIVEYVKELKKGNNPNNLANKLNQIFTLKNIVTSHKVMCYKIAHFFGFRFQNDLACFYYFYIYMLESFYCITTNVIDNTNNSIELNNSTELNKLIGFDYNLLKYIDEDQITEALIYNLSSKYNKYFCDIPFYDIPIYKMNFNFDKFKKEYKEIFFDEKITDKTLINEYNEIINEFEKIKNNYNKNYELLNSVTFNL